MAQLTEQIMLAGVAHPVQEAVHLQVNYYPGDKRRRDVAGMLDAIGHCFERANIVSDDKLLEDVTWKTHPVDRVNPRVEMEVDLK